MLVRAKVCAVGPDIFIKSATLHGPYWTHRLPLCAPTEKRLRERLATQHDQLREAIEDLKSHESALDLEQRIRDITPRLKDVGAEIKRINSARDPIDVSIGNANKRLRSIDVALLRSAQVLESKLKACQRMHKGAVRFRVWLDQNKGQFEKEVFGPLAMVRWLERL